MIQKEFLFRGKKLEELTSMDLDNFAKLLNSRGRRTVLRNKEVYAHISKKIKKSKEAKKFKPVRTHQRAIIIVPEMIGNIFSVYRGNSFEQVEIKQEMLGHYLGEMVLTRRRVSHGKAGIGATRSSTAVQKK